MTNERKYHHGDLKPALLKEAKAILAEEGVDGLSLRKLADRAGVSRQAPYHHFKDKQSLLCAIAAEGFGDLDALLARGRTNATSRDALTALLGDYLKFASDNPERYELMFGRRIWKLSEPTPELRDVAYASFRHYMALIKQITDASQPALPAKRVLRVAQASWATLHGLSNLSNDGIYVDPDDIADVSVVAVEMLMASLQLPQ